MSRVRTKAMLQSKLDEEFAWRSRELQDHRTVLRDADGPRKRMLLRAGIALLYSHWEGFTKKCTQLYIEFVHYQRLNYESLAPCFATIGLRAELEILRTTNKAQLNIAALETIRSATSRPAQIASFEVNTASNLKFHIFEGVAASIGIDSARYETKQHLIDELVDARNAVAHGDFIRIETEDYINKTNEILQIMRDYKTDIENAFFQDKFKA